MVGSFIILLAFVLAWLMRGLQAATSAVCLLTSATFSATALGFVQAWDVEYAPQDSVVYGEGKTGGQARAPISESLSVVLTFLVAPFISPSTAAASLVLVGKDHAGAAQTITCIQMRPRGISNRTVVQGMAMWTQHFEYVGDFVVFPLTVT